MKDTINIDWLAFNVYITNYQQLEYNIQNSK